MNYTASTRLLLPTAVAIRHLQKAVDSLPLSAAGDCASFLRRICVQLDILNCYRHFFPDRFAASTASLEPTLTHAQRNTLAEETDLPPASPREIEFFKLVDDELFPLHPNFLIDSGWYVHIPQPPFVPVTWLGYTYEYDQDPTDLDFPLRVLLTLNGTVTSDDEAADFLDRLVPGWPGRSVDWPAFRQACVDLGSGYAELPELILSICGETDNWWIDATPEMNLPDVEWSIDLVSQIQEEFASCKAILDRAKVAHEFFDDDPVKWQPALDAWMAHSRIETQKRYSYES